jgi:uncharacterized protein YlxW (UPF0749 family)
MDDYSSIDAQHKCIVLKEEVMQLRKENEQLRRQLEDIRMHVASVERLWRKMKDDMEIK